MINNINYNKNKINNNKGGAEYNNIIMADAERHYVLASVPGSAWNSFGCAHATVPNARATNSGPIDVFKVDKSASSNTYLDMNR
jgi:hypothetical protein